MAAGWAAAEWWINASATALDLAAARVPVTAVALIPTMLLLRFCQIGVLCPMALQSQGISAVSGRASGRAVVYNTLEGAARSTNGLLMVCTCLARSVLERGPLAKGRA